MKTATSFRLSPEAMHLLKTLSENKGLSQASVIEMLLREAAKREGIK